MPHPKNKKIKIQIQSSVNRIATSYSPAHQREKNKQTNIEFTSFHQSTNKSHTKKKPTQTTGTTLHSKGRNQKEGGIRPESLRKGDIKCNNERKKKKKRYKKYCSIKEQTRSTQDQKKKKKKTLRGNSSNTWKKIQNNDGKDVPKPWK